MQATTLKEKIERKYDGLLDFAKDFEKIVSLAVESARNAEEFAKIMAPLLRKSLVWVKPERVDAVSVAIERGDVVVRLRMPSCEIKVTKYYAEVLEPSVYIEG